MRSIATDRRNPFADLDNEIVHLFIGPASDLSERYESNPILEHRLVCLADESDSLPEVLSLDAYLSRPHLVISYNGDLTSWADTLLEEMSKTRSIGLVTPHGPAIGEIRRGSGMITRVTGGVAQRVAVQGGLHIYAHALEERRLMTRQVWHKRLESDPQHRWFGESARAVHKGTMRQKGASSMHGTDDAIIGDPLKGREATSQVELIQAWAFAERTLPSCFETPVKGKVALVAQHLHEMNPQGYLLGKATDRHLSLPAIEVRKQRVQETQRDWIEPV